MGAYGAEVIKVESASHPDVMRLSQPFKDNIPGLDNSGMFPIYNNNKLGITLNMNKPQAANLAKRLISMADIVVVGYRPGLMEEWGLGYDELVNVKSDIIVLSITSQGQIGTRVRLRGFGYNVSALSGITNITGWPDREPCGTTQAYPDYVSPWFGVLAILAALDYRCRTGQGQHIDLTQYETTLHCLGSAIVDYTANGRIASRKGNRSDYAVPNSVYRCKGNDRWCAIAVYNDKEWKALCQAMGKISLYGNTKFSSFEARKANEDELDRIIEVWTTKLEAQDAMSKLQDCGVRAGVVQTIEDIYNDPQLAYLEHFVRVIHPQLGDCYYHNYPARLSKTPAQIGYAPCLGEHNYYVYHDLLGLSDEEFVKLSNSGVFY